MTYASEFFVMLTSEDSLNYFPENNPSDFYVRLPYLIMLDGDWCISASQVWMPKMWYNVQQTPIKIYKHTDGETDPSHGVGECDYIQAGYYQNVATLLKEINSCTSKDGVHYSSLTYDGLKHKITIDVLKGYELKLTKELALSLGSFETEFRGKKTLDMCPDLGRYETIAYISIDIIEGQLSGRGVCNNLKMINTYDTAFGDVIYDNIETNFARIASDRFDTIHITIKDRFASIIKQEGGTTMVQLHFRRL